MVINRIAFPKRCIFIVVFIYTYLNALIVYNAVIVVVVGYRKLTVENPKVLTTGRYESTTPKEHSSQVSVTIAKFWLCTSSFSRFYDFLTCTVVDNIYTCKII